MNIKPEHRKHLWRLLATHLGYYDCQLSMQARYGAIYSLAEIARFYEAAAGIKTGAIINHAGYVGKEVARAIRRRECSMNREINRALLALPYTPKP